MANTPLIRCPIAVPAREAGGEPNRRRPEWRGQPSPPSPWRGRNLSGDAEAFSLRVRISYRLSKGSGFAGFERLSPFDRESQLVAFDTVDREAPNSADSGWACRAGYPF